MPIPLVTPGTRLVVQQNQLHCADVRVGDVVVVTRVAPALAGGYYTFVANVERDGREWFFRGDCIDDGFLTLEGEIAEAPPVPCAVTPVASVRVPRVGDQVRFNRPCVEGANAPVSRLVTVLAAEDSTAAYGWWVHTNAPGYDGPRWTFYRQSFLRGDLTLIPATAQQRTQGRRNLKPLPLP